MIGRTSESSAGPSSPGAGGDLDGDFEGDFEGDSALAVVGTGASGGVGFTGGWFGMII